MRIDSGSIAFNGGPSGDLYYSANQSVRFPVTLSWAIVNITPRADPGVYTAWIKDVSKTAVTYALARTSNATAVMNNQISVIGWLA